jgi:hypothetical protein
MLYICTSIGRPSLILEVYVQLDATRYLADELEFFLVFQSGTGTEYSVDMKQIHNHNNVTMDIKYHM